MPTQSVTSPPHDLTPHPERALYHAPLRTLFIADLHLGKSAAFRAGGIPVPEATTTRDLDRLSRLVSELRPERLVILGDLLHAPTGRAPETLDAVAAWRASFGELSITMVRGNHDRRSGDPPDSWGMTAADPGLEVGPFVCLHEPPEGAELEALDGGYALCGHIHPAVALRPLPGRGRHGVRAACFWFTARYAVLPAFGSFTGCAVIRPAPADRVFILGEGAVLEAPRAPVP